MSILNELILKRTFKNLLAAINGIYYLVLKRMTQKFWVKRTKKKKELIKSVKTLYFKVIKTKLWFNKWIN